MRDLRWVALAMLLAAGCDDGGETNTSQDAMADGMTGGADVFVPDSFMPGDMAQHRGDAVGRRVRCDELACMYMRRAATLRCFRFVSAKDGGARHYGRRRFVHQRATLFGVRQRRV